MPNHCADSAETNRLLMQISAGHPEAFNELFEITAEIRGKTILEILRQHELTDLLEKEHAGNRVIDRPKAPAPSPEQPLTQ